jgi:hypothetical protein
MTGIQHGALTKLREPGNRFGVGQGRTVNTSALQRYSALVGVALSYPANSQIDFLEDFSRKEFFAISHESWTNLNTVLNISVNVMAQKQFPKSQETGYKSRKLVFDNLVDIFSICCDTVKFLLTSEV